MSRLEKLKRLEEDRYKLLSKANSRSYASLARQYRETLREIEEIEGGESTDDEIGEILSEREADGKPGAVRKNRSRVPRE